MNKLIIRNVDFAFPAPTKQVLQDINIVCDPGDITVVVGPSGCGKSTLLNLVAGLLTPVRGTIVLPSDRPNEPRRVGYVFQSAALVPWRTVWENALLGAEIVGRADEMASRCEALMRTYGLWEFARSFPASLSGGMQQRVSIIRAVLSGAKVMLMDEPFSNTDFALRRELQRDVFRIVNAERLITLIVTHDINDAVQMGDRILVLGGRPASVRLQIPIPLGRSNPPDGFRAASQIAPYIEQVGSELLAVGVK